MQTNIISVVEAGPKFMKIALLSEDSNQYIPKRYSSQHIIVHTGQHYHRKISDSLLEELGIFVSHHNLVVVSDAQECMI